MTTGDPPSLSGGGNGNGDGGGSLTSCPLQYQPVTRLFIAKLFGNQEKLVFDLTLSIFRSYDRFKFWFNSWENDFDIMKRCSTKLVNRQYLYSKKQNSHRERYDREIEVNESSKLRERDWEEF